MLDIIIQHVTNVPWSSFSPPNVECGDSSPLSEPCYDESPHSTNSPFGLNDDQSLTAIKLNTLSVKSALDGTPSPSLGLDCRCQAGAWRSDKRLT